MVAEIDLSKYTTANIHDLRTKGENDDTIADIRIYVAPCKRQISAAVQICFHILVSCKVLSCYIRVDDRLLASCCSTPVISERLESLLFELKEGNYFAFYDQEHFECIDRLWLEQRLYEIDGEIDRDPITLETQLADHLRSVYDCTGLTKPLAAILMMGDSSLIIQVMNTNLFQASPRVPQPNHFFGADRHYLPAIRDDRYKRKFLGSIDVNPRHKKAQAPTLPISPTASQNSLKRNFGTDSGVDSHAKRANTQSEPESEDMYN